MSLRHKTYPPYPYLNLATDKKKSRVGHSDSEFSIWTAGNKKAAAGTRLAPLLSTTRSTAAAAGATRRPPATPSPLIRQGARKWPTRRRPDAAEVRKYDI